MIPIYVASNTGFSGKTFVSLGLAMKLMDLGYKVGYIKPIGKVPLKQDKDVFDADALFVKDTLGLTEPLDVISPFVMTFEAQTMILKGRSADVRKKILTALRSLRKKDYVIVNGSGSLFEGSLLGINALSILNEMDARMLMVEPWRGELSADSLYGVKRLVGERFLGGVLNKVPMNTIGYVKESLRPFLEKKGVKVFGVFPKDRLLESVTVRRLVEILNGKVLCCEDRIDEHVENFMIGAMDVDSALSYFRRTPNKAVITGAHRADIQLAAMETSTRCIILTGGMQTNDVVLGKAQAKGVPIISVPDDTYTTIDRIEGGMGKASIREKGKVGRAREIIEMDFDINRFLKSLK